MVVFNVLFVPDCLSGCYPDDMQAKVSILVVVYVDERDTCHITLNYKKEISRKNHGLYLCALEQASRNSQCI